MNPSTPVATSDVERVDEAPAVQLIDFLAGLANTPRALVLLEVYVLGGASVRLDFSALARATGAARSSLSRAKASLVREGVLRREADGTVSLLDFRRWPSLQSRPLLLAWIARPPDDDRSPTRDDVWPTIAPRAMTFGLRSLLAR